VERLRGPTSELAIGPARLGPIETVFAASASQAHGLIGMGLLTRYNLIIDYPRSRVILEPEPIDLCRPGGSLRRWGLRRPNHACRG
jgi:hypothetical protein